MPKSKRQNFLFLKQILEETVSERSTDSAGESHHSEERKAKKVEPKSVGSSAGPTGWYPVKFSTACKNKSCQTKLSSFPLFPVPEETMWISDGDDGPKVTRVPRAKRKKQQSKVKDSKRSEDHGEKNGRRAESPSRSQLKNPDGTRKDFGSEHQLKHSSNPALLAWIHRKNILARKKHREERRERRAKRLVLEEESRLKSERLIESGVKVKQWFKSKRRQTWKSSRSKIAPEEVPATLGRDRPSTVPPPGYKVVKSFRCTENESSKGVGKTLREAPNKASPLREQNVSTQNHESTRAFESNTKTARLISVKPEDKGIGSAGYQRPKSSISTSSQKASDASPRHNMSTARPRTARERMEKYSRAKSGNENQSPSKMQSMSYDEWLRFKREADKKQNIQKKRELIDSHLEAVIAELGKQRVQRILSPRKEIDTGLKNSSQSLEKSGSQPTGPKSKRTTKYRWVSTKKPRPEPQGCDCPDSEQGSGDVSVVCQNENETVCSGEVSGGGDPKTLAVKFCKEIEEKCEELKPSMDKVLSILDAEIRKQKGKTKRRKEQSSLDDKYSTEVQRGSEIDIVDQESSSNLPSGNSRPKSAKPSQRKLTAEQTKKIKSDMDVLGLCGSSSDETLEESAEKSTVRDNYFDYGSDVDPPSMKPAKYTASAPIPDM